MTPINVPTGTVSPACTMIRARIPAAAASISTVAFSVSISAMAWPFTTGSPSFFSQRASSPSVMSKPKEGMMTLVGKGASSHRSVRGASRSRAGIIFGIRPIGAEFTLPSP
jgi:hypothetical protein